MQGKQKNTPNVHENIKKKIPILHAFYLICYNLNQWRSDNSFP